MKSRPCDPCSAIAPTARVRCVALVQWIIVWRCWVGTGDADVGSDACRIEMYLYNFVYLVVIWERIAVVGVEMISRSRHGVLLQV